MRRRNSSNLAFNDVLFNVLLGFVMLFIIAFLLINPISKKADIPNKSEVIIILEWNKESNSDIDLWVQRDDNNPVGFTNKQSAPLHLSRDDLGSKNDIVFINGKKEVIKQNREVITVRGIVPGDYYITIHGYNVDADNDRDVIKVRVIDVNPYKEQYVKTYDITFTGQKINAPGFTLDSEGNITEIWEHSRNLGPTKKELR